MNYRESKVLNGEIYSFMLKCAAAELRLHIKDVNDLNVFPVPDGDTGDNMWRTIAGGVRALDACRTEDLQDSVLTSSKGMLMGARGNSGVILSQFFNGITEVLKSDGIADDGKLITALKCGVKHAYAAVLDPVEGTILTVARESVDYAAANIGPGAALYDLFFQLMSGMRLTLEKTPDMLPALKQAGVIDSGGAGLYYIASGFVRALSEDVEKTEEYYNFKANLVDTVADQSGREESVNVNLFTADDVMKYGYCTELLVRLQNSKTDIGAFDDEAVKRFLSEIGDSVVYVRDGSLVKLHVHTFRPEAVMDRMHRYGEFLKLKVENMTLEHTDNDSPAAAASGSRPHNAKNHDRADGSFSGKNALSAVTNGNGIRKFFATVAVCMGRGLSETFSAMGVDRIIKGGQSVNPSSKDFIDAFSGINAEHIIVFPNNKNIVLSAKQAAGLYSGSEIHVIETADLGQGFVGLSAIYPEEENIDALLENINGAIADSCSGAVSVAVKSGNFDGIAVSAGDYIGFVGKKIISSERDIVSSAVLLCDYLLEGGRSVLTCFTGKDTDAVDNQLLEKAVGEKHPDVELFFVSGDQEVYNYIFVAD